MQISKRIKRYGSSFVIILTREDMEVLEAEKGDYVEGELNLMKPKVFKKEAGLKKEKKH